MSTIARRLSLFLCFCLLFQQTGFSQVAATLDLSGQFASLRSSVMPDKFRPVHLRSLSWQGLQNNFQLLLDKGDVKDSRKSDVERETKTLLDFFFIGLALSNDAFWVNLRPDGENNIIDADLARTDIGKILLEADVQLKKDTARFTSPETPEGKQYWDKLYKKAEELLGNDSVNIPTITRPWIVPGEIIIREAGESAYIYKATLKVLLEEDYLKNSSTYSFNDPRLKQLNAYSSQLIRELIIPKITKEVNTAKRYSSLRQVYYSLIMAQWFKKKFAAQAGQYSNRINTRNLAGLTSTSPWTKAVYFNAYQQSFKQGEYNTRQTVNSMFGQKIRNCFSGGITIVNIEKALAYTSTPGNSYPIYSTSNIPVRVVYTSNPGNMYQIYSEPDSSSAARSTGIPFSVQRDGGMDPASRSSLENIFMPILEKTKGMDMFEANLEKNKVNAAIELLLKKNLSENDLVAYARIIAYFMGETGWSGEYDTFTKIIEGCPDLASLQVVQEIFKQHSIDSSASGLLLELLARAVTISKSREEYRQSAQALIDLYKKISPRDSTYPSAIQAIRLIFTKSLSLQHIIAAMSAVNDSNSDTMAGLTHELWAREKMLEQKPTLEQLQRANALLQEFVKIDEEPSRAIIRGGMAWTAAARHGGKGVADFAYMALTSVISSATIHDLLMFARNVPGTTVARLEQNRSDILACGQTYLRDYIHDQKPLVHEVLLAVIKYYDTGENAQELIDYSEKDYSLKNLRNFLTSKEWFKEIVNEREEVIDVLRRLAQNTAPVQEEPPRVANQEAGVGYQEMDRVLQNLYRKTAAKGFVDTISLLQALREANKILKDVTISGQMGIQPSFILALGWLEHMAYRALQEARESRFGESSMKNRDLELLDNLYKTNWFIEVFEFFLRIHSTSDCENEVNAFRKKFHGGEAPEVIYKAVSSKVFSLTEEWVARKQDGEDINGIWTNNLFDSFFMLADIYKQGHSFEGQLYNEKDTRGREQVLEEYIWGIRRDGGLEDDSSQKPLTEAARAKPEQQTSNAPANKGGIDFRALPIVTQPAEVFKLTAAEVDRLRTANIDAIRNNLFKLVEGGMVPSKDRIKEYVMACCVKQQLDKEMDKLLGCIAAVLRQEEERGEITDHALRNLLLLVESGKSENQNF